jgi:hypothetical protein
MAGVLNLTVIGAFARTQNVFSTPEILEVSETRRDHESR